MSWENMTGKEIKRIQEKDCKYCKNSIKISSIDSGCDYLAIHKKKKTMQARRMQSSRSI